MPDKKADAANGGYFTSEGCDVLEIREEDTKPGPGLSEKDKQRLREKYGGKMPPPSDPSEPDILEIREEDTQPGKHSERMEEK
ncbi:MAG: hypothetical protein L0Y72_01815 [Gemmataceae bacterium]|nr:hypothetical protein [Gemmataceae bacterium]MCI0737752.1 hypothetical protein [Gemmataceae bacterium]